MRRTKKPHFVPCAYLQFWDTEENPENGRNSSVYWSDGIKQGKQKVGTLAVQSNLYSVNNPNEAESFFSEFENNWSKLVKQLRSGNAPPRQLLSGLLLTQSIFFLLRNPKFSNNSEQERIHNYKIATEIFWQSIFMKGKKSDNEMHALQQLNANWVCHFLPCQSDPWITSDNPVLLLSIGENIPSIVFLPITPKWALIALDSDVTKLTKNKITSKDVELLNTYTVINSNRHVFSNTVITEVEMKSISKWFNRRPTTESWISESEIRLQPLKYPVAGMNLSFFETIK
jgi:hypothetical protein